MKTKMMIVSTSKARRERFGQSIQLGTFNFETVEKFLYLGSLITNKNILDEEIGRRLILANRSYYGLQKVFNSKFLSRNTKIQMFGMFLFEITLNDFALTQFLISLLLSISEIPPNTSFAHTGVFQVNIIFVFLLSLVYII